MSTKPPLRLAAIGCGGRTRTYLGLAAKDPGRYKVVAAADPDSVRVEAVAALSGNPEFRRFRDDAAILAEPQLADVMVIGTQDAQHAGHAVAAMERGYDLLLEKPVAPNPQDVGRIHEAAQRLGRRVSVCHVLRYTAFYSQLRRLVREGAIGELVSLNAVEGADPWHQAHSFVRGHWSRAAHSSPMILAKSCHDLDIIRWIVDAPCASVASHGRNSHFHRGNLPPGAPVRCHDGCPVGDTCLYNARRYLGDQQRWLGYIMSGCKGATPAQRAQWLKTSPWSRCVYQCDNDTVDHQTVAMEFANGVTATFTMTAFDSGRSIQLYGTRGRLRAGEPVHRDTGKWFVLEPHEGPGRRLDIEMPAGGYDGHLGGDSGLVEALHDEMTGPVGAMVSPLSVAVDSHWMAFAAEQSRLSGKMVRL